MKSPLREFVSRLTQSIFLLIIFFLPTQLGLHFWPEFSIVGGLRIDYLSPTLYFTDVLIVLLIAIWVTGKYLFSSKALNSKLETLNKHKANQNPKILIATFFIILIIGIMFSARPLAGLFGLLKLMELFLFGLIAVRLLTAEKVFKRTLLVYAVGMLVQSLIAIAQFYNQGSLNGSLYFLGERTFNSSTPGIANASLNGVLVLRPYATLPHPNVLAGYLLIGLTLLKANSERQTVKGKKIFFYITAVLGLITFILTMSRSAIFTGLILTIITFKNIFLKTKNKKQLRIVLFTLASIASLLSPLLIYRFLDLNLNNEPIIQRINLAKASILMFLGHPLFGVGLSNFLVRLPEYVSLTNTPIQPVHNIYLLMLAETGLIGLMLTGFFAYKLFLKTRMKKSFSINNASLIFLAILLLGLNDHYLLTLQQGKLLLTLSMCIIYARDKLLSA